MNRTVMNELQRKRNLLDRQIEAARQMPDFQHLPNGSLLTLQVRYTGSTSPKPYTFVAFKAKGLWYFTGRGPHQAGHNAVAKWLLEHDRMLVSWDGCVLDDNAKFPRWVGSGTPTEQTDTEQRYREALEQISSEGSCLCSADNVDCGHTDTAYIADLALGKHDNEPGYWEKGDY